MQRKSSYLVCNHIFTVERGNSLLFYSKHPLTPITPAWHQRANFLPSPFSNPKSKRRTAGSAHNMHEIRHAVLHKQNGEHLLSQIQDSHQNHRQRNLAAGHSGKGSEHDEHKDNAACTQQCSVREEGKLQNTGNKRGKRDAGQQDAAAVFLLHGRADDEEQKHVVQKMSCTAVTEDVAEKAHIGQRIIERSAVYGKDRAGRPSAGDSAEDQCNQGNEEETEDDGGVVLQFFHGVHLRSKDWSVYLHYSLSFPERQSAYRWNFPR